MYQNTSFIGNGFVGDNNCIICELLPGGVFERWPYEVVKEAIVF